MTDPILTDRPAGHNPPRRDGRHHLDCTGAIPVVRLLGFDPTPAPQPLVAPQPMPQHAPAGDRARAALAPLTSHEGFKRFLGGLAVAAAIVGLLVLLLALRAVTR